MIDAKHFNLKIEQHESKENRGWTQLLGEGKHFLLYWGIRRATVVLPINEFLLLLLFHWILTCTDSGVFLSFYHIN